jgi:U3 small nucleolar RNA-associated protein MPP10
VQELAVRSDVPALAMEEAAPLAASAASLRRPDEAYAAQAAGDVRSEAELSREERRARRARKKSAGKARRAAAAFDARARAVAEGRPLPPVAGRKSLAEELKSKGGRGSVRVDSVAPGGSGGGRSEFGKSTAVFARIQGERGAGTAVAAAKAAAAAAKAPAASGVSLKL